MDIEHEMIDAKERISKLEVNMLTLMVDVKAIRDSQGTTATLCKWVITPLLIIVGALVGVKLIMPTA
jgi:hypothetical protein